MADFHDIKSSLMLLDRNELSVISKTCEALLARNTELDKRAVDLYEAIQLLLSRKGYSSVGIALFKKNKASLFETLLDTSVMLDSWMKQVGVSKDIDKKLLLIMLCELVSDKIEFCGIEVNMSTMIAFYKHAPSYFDNAFPGYSQTNMVKIMIKSRQVRNYENV